MVGMELAKGRKLEEIVGSMKMVAEGIKTTGAAKELAERHGVDMPITEQMHQVLYTGTSPAEAVRRLMVRTLKGE
jgi:glycerol-3-phosphate dehydrogenase (NAD(P)+)